MNNDTFGHFSACWKYCKKWDGLPFTDPWSSERDCDGLRFGGWWVVHFSVFIHWKLTMQDVVQRKASPFMSQWKFPHSDIHAYSYYFGSCETKRYLQLWVLRTKGLSFWYKSCRICAAQRGGKLQGRTHQQRPRQDVKLSWHEGCLKCSSYAFHNSTLT